MRHALRRPRRQRRLPADGAQPGDRAAGRCATRCDRHDFLEVETPLLQPLHGGAAARPFSTHLNAFDQTMYLRIAIELYLKRLVVGGLDRVYEIGRNFRNEGVDSTHSPEFTMLEVYEAYGDYGTMATLTREIVLDAARALGSTVVPDGRGGEIDLEGEWRHLPILEAVSDAVGEEVDVETPAEVLRKIADRHDVALQPSWDAAEIVVELYEQLVEDTPAAADLRHRLPGRGQAAGQAAPRRSPAWSRPGTSSSAASSWRRRTPSSTTRSSSGAGWSSSRSRRPAATPRRCSSTRTSCGRWSSACRRRAGWGWASTG